MNSIEIDALNAQMEDLDNVPVLNERIRRLEMRGCLNVDADVLEKYLARVEQLNDPVEDHLLGLEAFLSSIHHFVSMGMPVVLVAAEKESGGEPAHGG